MFVIGREHKYENFPFITRHVKCGTYKTFHFVNGMKMMKFYKETPLSMFNSVDSLSKE